MNQVAVEHERLAQNDAHIAEAERHVAEQMASVAALDRGGHDTTEAERLLSNMRGLLEQHHAHRRNILDVLERAQAEEATSASLPDSTRGGQ